MSDININAIRQPLVNTELPTATNRSPAAAPASPPVAAAPALSPGADSVTLSAAAQTTGPTANSRATLSESDANRTAADLRQQLGAQSLSSTARQNQAILSLLR